MSHTAMQEQMCLVLSWVFSLSATYKGVSHPLWSLLTPLYVQYNNSV